MGNVVNRALNCSAINSSLDQGVLLRMQPPAQFVALTCRNALLFPQAADLQAMFKTGRGAVIAARQNPLVFDNEGPDLSPEAGGAAGHHPGDVHEVLVPIRPAGDTTGLASRREQPAGPLLKSRAPGKPVPAFLRINVTFRVLTGDIRFVPHVIAPAPEPI
ncbi:MAG: hypothetical protein BWY80_00462 [Firmicutes bacterium ADurb.Bin456]|nr:MAG: hypothetical protein BWY80_00462 [Firmicutes bacterium ADurb.Bin456]